jgi:ABC-type antimicrobial peptide transport system permease subunit
MTSWTLIRRSLRFHARAHLGVVLGAAIGSAALIGALMVGDSLKDSLLKRALERVGTAQYLLAPADRVFSDSTNTWTGAFGNSYALGLHLTAAASAKEGAARANRVQLYGVGPEFWRFSPVSKDITIQPGSLLLNRALASQLAVSAGDFILVRFHKPSMFSEDAPLSSASQSSLALRLKVQAVLAPEDFGNFSATAGPAPPLNAFVRLDELQHAAGLDGRANLVLAAGIQSELGKHWNVIDAGLNFTPLENQHAIELRSKRVFLDPPVVQKVTHPTGRFALAPARVPAGNEVLVLTYLANSLRAGANSTPYSMITAAGPPYTPADMRDDEIIINQWLADDLRVRPGDWVSLASFQPESGAKLLQSTNRFRVHAIVPLSGIYADPTLMPDFPGIEKAESTSDWDAGFPVDLKVIRAKDEEYWKEHRGTPKAFLTLAAGQRMWGCRFGDVTSIRFPVPTTVPPGEYQRALEKSFLELVHPEELGLHFEPVRAQALRAAEQGQDFGQLFLGFSIFLVAAALLLMALLFQFGLEQRATEVGTLLALGFTAGRVRRLLLIEGVALALIGGCLGAAGGIAYAKTMLWGLATVWRGAVGTATLQFHFTLASLVAGVFAGTVVGGVTIWLTLRKQARQPAYELLAGMGLKTRMGSAAGILSRALWVAVAAAAGAIAIVGWALARRESANAEAFFGAGSLLLVAGLALVSSWLGALEAGAARRQPGKARLTLPGLAVRGCARRRRRSLATVALLACGAFVIVAIGVFRLDANQDATRRSSGTGGFALIGESTAPVIQDLNTSSGREAFGLDPAGLEGVDVVSLRVHEGDDASCLNLNRAQTPRLLGVNPELLAGRFTFAKVARNADAASGWRLLYGGRPGDTSALRAPHSALNASRLASAAGEVDEIPAIGDANSIEWALGKKIGDTIDYTDEHGRAFKLRLVGAVANSILQGSLIIDETEFLKKFPSQSGWRMFLIDAPSNSLSRVSATLSRALEDMGLELTPAAQRLAAFNEVQNTYLGTFQVLGGLGLLLGSAGLGVVVLRNVLERRGELGLLLAVGFRRRTLEKLVLFEHGALLLLGLGIGVAAAAVAVLPALLSPGTHLPGCSLAVTLGAVLLNGAAWTWLATRYALRGNLLEALRNE